MTNSNVKFPILVVIITSLTLVVNIYQYKRIVQIKPPRIAGLHKFPFLQVEREHFSRKRAMKEAYRTFKLFSLLKENCPDKRILKDHTCSAGLFQDDAEYKNELKFILRDIGTLAGLGLLTAEEARIPTENPQEPPKLENQTDAGAGPDEPPETFDPYTFSSSVDFDPRTFCYNSTFSWLNDTQPVDPELCFRLENLALDIQHGSRDPLLTIFTWWPDPLYDTEKMTRRNSLISLSRLRPFITPVVFTASRNNMALANSLDWPCFEVPRANADGIPIFKDMAAHVQARFTSTYYGYAQASTLFDASLVDTLVAVAESSRALVKTSGSKQSGMIQQRYLQIMKKGGKKPEKEVPVFITGQSFFTERSFSADVFHDTLRKMSQQHRLVKMDHRVLYYAVFSSTVHFNDLPDVIIDDAGLIHFLEEFTRLHNVVVVNATNTILSVHHSRSSILSEWGKKYLPLDERDDKYNKRLVDKFNRLEKVENNYNKVISSSYGFNPTSIKISLL